ncbi:DUF1634 domain-containing protein [Clostridium folliculivorans]|uniref:Membrane protein n=1 Tax=Clostridium folliculivorans TaxID=2886038 RepID=A0A9W5Y4T6_9CLOT|nr:DUF1634 domain-containing protein [Clostridium folliculivorans]GKU26668.1 membrane protein [Clostridium folliculivorans]GKU28900.1 membrane protein [Clostridium folliculivorans]
MEEDKIAAVEITISKMLRIGVVLSATVIIIGLIMFLITGKSGYCGNTYPTTVGEIFSGLLQFKSYGIIMTGLLLLIVTPIFRVGVSIIVFMKEKDYMYVKITATVFIILILSFAMGKVG